MHDKERAYRGYLESIRGVTDARATYWELLLKHVIGLESALAPPQREQLNQIIKLMLSPAHGLEQADKLYAQLQREMDGMVSAMQGAQNTSWTVAELRSVLQQHGGGCMPMQVYDMVAQLDSELQAKMAACEELTAMLNHGMRSMDRLYEHDANMRQQLITGCAEQQQQQQQLVEPKPQQEQEQEQVNIIGTSGRGRPAEFDFDEPETDVDSDAYSTRSDGSDSSHSYTVMSVDSSSGGGGAVSAEEEEEDDEEEELEAQQQWQQHQLRQMGYGEEQEHAERRVHEQQQQEELNVTVMDIDMVKALPVLMDRVHIDPCTGGHACPVCMNLYEEEALVGVTGCNHILCIKCCGKCTKCPFCRQNLPSPFEVAAPEAAAAALSL